MKQKLYLNIVILLCISFLSMAVQAKNDVKGKKNFTVVIDAGHGGKDIGANDNKATEKEINLGVALAVRKLVDKKLKDVDVVMTRDNDTYLTLQERADIANKAKGDLFISIHTNSVDKSNKNRKNVKGSSVYALGLHKDDNNMRVAQRENSVIELEDNFKQKYSGFDPSKDESYIIFEMARKKNLAKSIRFAEEVQKQLVKSGRANRGVHQAGFWVLWATSMPSVLIELDFICNPVSASYMTSDKGRKELANSIFKAIEKYHESWEKAQEKLIAAGYDSESAENTEEIGQESGSRLVAVSGKSSTKKDLSSQYSTARQRQGSLSGKRKRRSESSRMISNTRNLETTDIPLHKEAERMGKTVEPETFAMTDDSATPDADKNKKADKKKKKNKKDKKKKDSSKKAKRDPSSHNAKIEKFVKVYKIQILASADLLKQSNPRFHGLAPISTYKENNLYKYYYGESQDEKEIGKMLQKVKELIPDAFVVSSLKSTSALKN